MKFNQIDLKFVKLELIIRVFLYNIFESSQRSHQIEHLMELKQAFF